MYLYQLWYCKNLKPTNICSQLSTKYPEKLINLVFRVNDRYFSSQLVVFSSSKKWSENPS